MIRKTSHIPGNPSGPANWLVFLLFAMGTAVLYFPVAGNGFLTDDYASLYRLLIEKRVLYRESLRPLIDISFLFNWLFTGLHPFGYYVFNFCIHALSCFMVYRVALDLPLYTVSKQPVFALTAGFLFLFYPFHNEGVVWLSGRLSSMAALFGLMAIHFSLTRQRPWDFVLALLFWVTGLFAYESIVMLPAIIMGLQWMKYRDVARALRSAVAWAIAGLLWLGMRWMVTGGVLSDYGRGGMAAGKGEGIGTRLVKVFGRCFLPPLENSRLLVLLFAGLVVGIGLLHVFFWRRRNANNPSYLMLEVVFLLSLVPAIAFGVSTRTSEGDRLLYFPSCFLCLLIGALITSGRTSPWGRRWRLAFCAAFAIAGVVFIEGNNTRWVFASRTAGIFLDTIRSAPGRVVLVNAPDEWEGAYIFRNNFNTGLVVNGIDTNRVVVPHFLMRLEYLPVVGRIEPVWKDGGVFIYPGSFIPADSFRVEGERVYYWDKLELKRLNLSKSEPPVR